jgi:OmpA-OmpF porin, OOP family
VNGLLAVIFTNSHGEGRMKKQLITFLASGILCLATMQSQADSYFGVSGGVTDIDTGVTALTGTASLDETDSGFKVFYGFKIKPQIAIEFHYANLGEATLSGNNGDNFSLENTTYVFTANNATIKSEADSFGVSGVYSFVEKGTFVPFVKLGLHRWSVDYTETASNLSAATVSDDGFDISLGLGADINLSDSFAIRVEYESFDLDGTDVTFGSIGANFKF